VIASSTRRRVAAATVLACAVAPFVGIAPARAAEITVTDATGDVRNANNGNPTPTVNNGDFTQVTYNHRRARVVITGDYVDLEQPRSTPQGEDTSLFFATRMRTDEDVYRVAFTGADSSEPGGETELFGRRGRRVRCDVEHNIDYLSNSIRVSIPRSCLSRPNWIRFTSIHLTFDRNRATVDNPHDDGADPTAWTSKVFHD
jgi:hypothetical protein